jgi:hypothetical protein
MEYDDDTWDQWFLESLGVQNDIENQDSDTEETDPTSKNIILP